MPSMFKYTVIKLFVLQIIEPYSGVNLTLLFIYLFVSFYNDDLNVFSL